jgi:hypothetical protein
MKSRQIDLNYHIQNLRGGDDSSFSYLYGVFETPLINHLFQMLGTQEKA